MPTKFSTLEVRFQNNRLKCSDRKTHTGLFIPEFANAPVWLIELVGKVPRGSISAATPPEVWRSFIDDTHDGSHRGSAVARLYGLLVRHYIDPVVSLSIVRMFNAARCQPPLDDSEVVRIANDIANREADRREGGRHGR